MNRNQRLAQMTCLQDIELERKRLNLELRKQEKGLRLVFDDVLKSFSLIGSISGLVRKVAGSFSLVNGIGLGIKLVSLFFRRKF